MRTLQSIRPSYLRLRLVGLVTVTRSIACNKYAGEEGIELFEHPRDLLSLEYLDLVLEFTGNEKILADLIKHKPSSVGVLDQHASLLFFDIARLYDQVAEQNTEVNLATSFASALLEASPDGVIVIDRDYRIINCNDSPLITSGRSREEILGRHCYEILHRSTSPCVGQERTCPTLETLKTGKPARTVYEIVISKGNTRICQVTTYPIASRFGEIAQFVVTVRDMTKELSERIEQRAQAIKDDLTRFVQDDRLTSLGRLVASVCHEINNPITSIVTFNKLILSYLNDGVIPHKPKGIADIQRYLNLSIQEALRCGRIVTNLLTFARQKDVDSKRIDLHEVITTVTLLIHHQLESAGIRFVQQLPHKPFCTWGDSAQIQQCLMNLMFNAIDAMPGGGTITISGGEDEANGQIWLAITDTGQGLATEDLPRIFEPFYSTKKDGKGVGLGLSMVYGIIREHNGTVEVDSPPGEGATFRIKLPCHLPDSSDIKE
jgi:PAS domain S-box-containing protein